LPLSTEIGGEDVEEQRGAVSGQHRGERSRRLSLSDRSNTRRKHRTGIHACVEAHDRHTGLGVAGLNRGANRPRPAPPRKQGTMHVEAAMRERIEQFHGQDSPIGHHDADFGA
jgi:hypothetical protein